jgi:polar amino acid transport system substrate-binding protein
MAIPLIRHASVAIWLSLASLSAAGAQGLVTLDTDDLSRRFEIRDGVAMGFLADLLRQALAGAGYRTEFHIRPWVRCFEETRSGQVDGMFALYRTPEREQQYLFTNEPLDIADEYIYVRRGRKIDSAHWPDALKGKRVGVVNGTYHGHRFLEAEQAHLFAAVESVGSYESLIEMLGAGRIDAAFATIDIMRDAMNRVANADRIERAEPAIDTLPIYLAFTRQRDMTAVRDGFDRELRKMRDDGRYDALVRQYPH